MSSWLRTQSSKVRDLDTMPVRRKHFPPPHLVTLNWSTARMTDTLDV